MYVVCMCIYVYALCMYVLTCRNSRSRWKNHPPLLSTLFIAKERNRTIIASEKINKEQLSEELHLNFYEEIKEYEKEFYNERINK